MFTLTLWPLKLEWYTYVLTMPGSTKSISTETVIVALLHTYPGLDYEQRSPVNNGLISKER